MPYTPESPHERDPHATASPTRNDAPVARHIAGRQAEYVTSLSEDPHELPRPAARAVSGGRIARSLRPASLAGRTFARWARTYASFGSGRRAARDQFALRTAEDVRRTMGEMKGAIMKFGQILSLMTGVIPDDMLGELAALQADAPPMAYSLVEQVFEQEYGRTPQQIFRRFEREPFAAASIGQVHRAVLRDGTPAAVKVQYPGVREAIEHDLANVGLLISLGARFSQGLDAGPIVRDLKDGILGELDYVREAAWQQRFHDEFDGHGFIYVPRVYPELSTSRVLVQELVRGRPFAAARALPQGERNRVGEIVFRYAFGSIYRHGLFNGDPHPGNYLLRDDGSVAFVDYGCVAEFDAGTVDGFIRVLRALYAEDRDAWRAGIEEIGILRRGAPFTTEELYDHMHWYWEPVLHERIAFTPELAGEMVRRNTQTTGAGGRINEQCNVPAGMVFLTRINFGLAGLLANIRAEGPWRAIVAEYIDDAPPATELGAVSARTSRGAPV
ncbi:MAG: AarF/ABC1/UbiB kinase family protein [Dehalococcoidia bacterium]|nr:AarF/ABC1/UbiB kinase family protein [Dehalococcoidia bacterium]